MPLITLSLPEDGTITDAADYNNPLRGIANLLNGNLDSLNFTDASFTAAKIAAGAITAPKITDDVITAAKIDWASTGVDAGIWWEEIGRAVLGAGSDTLSVSGMAARKYLMVIFFLLPTGGTITGQMRFGNNSGLDNGNNYANRYASNGTGTTNTAHNTLNTDSIGGNQTQFGVYEIINILGQEKLVTGGCIGNNGTGANIPNRRDFSGKWVNTTSQITRVDLINTGAGDFATGSEIVVLGHD